MARGALSEPGRARLTSRTVRLIASRLPIVGVFDDVAESEDDKRAAFELEDLTNTRQIATERLRAIPGGEVPLGGGGASMVMAAFLYASETGGRFSDHRLGAWYAATELETALAETVFHHERRLRASTAGFPARIQMRELVTSVDTELLDLRGQRHDRPELYDPNDYSSSQAFAVSRRWPFVLPGGEGLVYDSVRRPGGVNLCIWRPLTVPLPVRQGDHYEYNWDPTGAISIFKLTGVAF